MGWREQYRQASFRNVPFFVGRADSSFGRRKVVHEFPGQDKPVVEDLGRSAREFAVEGYALGDDYLAQRDRIKDAVEKEGPGILIHPYYGKMRVECSQVSIQDNVRELNMVRFTFTFVESGEPLVPERILDTVTNLQNAKVSALSTVNEAFKSAYSLVRKPYAAYKNALNTIDSGLAIIESAKNVVASIPNFETLLNDVKDRARTLVSNAEELGDAFLELIPFGSFPDDEIFAADEDNSRTQFDEMKKLFNLDPDEEAEDDDPAQIFSLMFQQMAVITAAGLTGLIEYDSLDDAEEIQDVLLSKMDELQEGEMADEVYETFRTLREAVIADSDERGKSLARLTSYKPNQSTPAITIAQSLYSDIEQEQDIIDRNKIQHPGFVPGSISIEVLTSV